MNKKEGKKTTNEKPVTLSPLNFKEALSGLMQVKPETKPAKKPRKKTGNKKGSATMVLMSAKDITDESIDRVLDELLGKE